MQARRCCNICTIYFFVTLLASSSAFFLCALLSVANQFELLSLPSLVLELVFLLLFFSYAAGLFFVLRRLNGVQMSNWQLLGSSKFLFGAVALLVSVAAAREHNETCAICFEALNIPGQGFIRFVAATVIYCNSDSASKLFLGFQQP